MWSLPQALTAAFRVSLAYVKKELESTLLCLTTLVTGLPGLSAACTCVLHSSREVWVHLKLVCTALPDHAVFAFPVLASSTAHGA